MPNAIGHYCCISIIKCPLDYAVEGAFIHFIPKAVRVYFIFIFDPFIAAFFSIS